MHAATLHSGANFRFFVWLSTDKKKDNIFVYTFYTAAENECETLGPFYYGFS